MKTVISIDPDFLEKSFFKGKSTHKLSDNFGLKNYIEREEYYTLGENIFIIPGGFRMIKSKSFVKLYLTSILETLGLNGENEEIRLLFHDKDLGENLNLSYDKFDLIEDRLFDTIVFQHANIEINCLYIRKIVRIQNPIP
ncbi:MAG: hypothetical protein LUE98_18895 [Tannerellaceae bacterium]|nr:hypothetical protein [Tannerellaceae bacterium]